MQKKQKQIEEPAISNSEISDKEFRSIYDDDDEKGIDMSVMDHKKRDRVKSFLIGAVIILVILAIASWAGYFITTKSQIGFEKADVNLAVSGLEQTDSAGEITYYIKYSNDSQVSIHDCRLEVKFPDGFKYSKANVEPVENRESIHTLVWDLGEIKAGEGGRVEAAGALIGQIDSSYTVSASFAYIPKNFNSPFTRQASTDTKITGSKIELKFEGPDKAPTKEEVSYKITYKNNSENVLQNLRVEFQSLGQFEISQPAKEYNKDETVVADGKYVWDIATLAKGQEDFIEVKGQYLTEKDENGQKTDLKLPESAQISASISINNKDDEYYLQKQELIQTEFIKGDVGMNLIINGTNESKAIKFGDKLAYSISFKNKGKEKMEDIEISALIQGTPAELVNWGTLSSDNKGVHQDDRITWTKKEFKNITFIDPGEEVTLNFSINASQPSSLKDFSSYEDKNFKIVSTAKIKIGKVGNTQVNQEVESNSVELLVNSDLSLESVAKYFDDDGNVIGSGPLPPQLGKTTTFKIYWTVTNHLHEVTDIKVTAKLPDNINWTGQSKIPAGDIYYNSNDRTIEWSINRIPVDVNKLVASFDLGFTPQSKDMGNTVKLLNESSIQAIDKETKGSIISKTNYLTSDLGGAQGGGAVEN